MSDTDVIVGDYQIGVEYVDGSPTESSPARVELLTRWLVTEFERQQKELQDVIPKSAG